MTTEIELPGAGLAFDATTAPTMISPPLALGEWIDAHPGRILVDVQGTTIAGVIRRGTRLARILSIEGRSSAAISAFVDKSATSGCLVVRAELSEEDPTGSALIEAGFRIVDSAVHAAQPSRGVTRFERRLDGRDDVRKLSYYSQTTWFTCGPVTLMLARRRFETAAPVDRRTEVRLWREATTVHAPTGPGGCEPFGMACAAARCGMRARVVSSIEGPFLMDRASDDAKRDLMLFVQAEFRAEARELGVGVEIREWTHADLEATVAAGGVAIVLIDQIVFHGQTMPHWVLVHGARDGIYTVDDPWVEPDDWETDTDKFDIPVPAPELDRMSWYGRTPYRAAVLLEP